MEWAEFLHAEIEKVRQYVTGPNYPTGDPSADAANGIVHTFMARTEILRRACLICGRWGTPEANRAVARAIQSLSFAAVAGTGYTNCLKLREFGASISFYWNMAGLLDRGDLDAVHTLQTLKLRDLTSAKDAVMVLPFSRYQVGNWKFLKDHDRFYAPASAFLAKKFTAEALDIALGQARGDELFDQTELTIALEHAHQRSQGQQTTWMPLGRFVWKNRGQWLEEELKRVEGLSDDDAFFNAGLMGGGKETAAGTTQKIRRWIQSLPF